VDATLLPRLVAQLHTTAPGQGYWDFRKGGRIYAQPVYFVSIEGTRALQQP
jgi:hypothetical protein